MKLSNKVVPVLGGLGISALYFIAVLFLYDELNILHVFPIFAGEDDFSIRRLGTFSILIPSFIIIGWLLGVKIASKGQIPLQNLFGMFLSSIAFGFLVFLFKDKLSAIDERDLVNKGVLFYFLIFVLLNFCGYLLPNLLTRKI